MDRILVIDDDDEVRAPIRKFLVREGYDVAEAPDGEECIRLLRQYGAELVVLDIIMPNKEGIESIFDLRSEFPEVKIIAISGGGLIGPDEYLRLARTCGAHRILTKPFELEELLEAVQQLLEQAWTDS
jgi:DNA-binding response OmpR family regulator